MRVHFIAIGGSVMHQLAISLARKGYLVSGSDDEIFEPARSNLEKEGILPAATGWDPVKITPDLDAVILGMHAKDDNPEVLRAQELGLKIYSFPEYIFQESRHKKRVVVGGSHGKTTTTAMIMHVLKQEGMDFDYMVGARLPGFEYAVSISDAPVIICEGDEYPASALEKRPKFHFLFPHIAVITGIAWDHINVFPTFDFYLEQFRLFIRMIEPGGMLVYNETDPVLRELVAAEQVNIRKTAYGIPEHQVVDGQTTVVLNGMQMELRVFGTHNLLNLHAAWIVCRELGLPADHFLKHISGFAGASKRLELLAEKGNTRIYRDFAHAPSKVKATIAAMKEQFPDRRLIAVLELHTYSSLQAGFMSEYKGALDPADAALLYYSAHALELKRLPPLDPQVIRNGFANPELEILNSAQELSRWLRRQSYENSNLLLMSSGNYDGLDIATFAKEITA
ncbi:MAG: Mur ligase family protein [Bacteroidota bacterium]|nr:Mur ligase family protein [Bacteroidota bacterium]